MYLKVAHKSKSIGKKILNKKNLLPLLLLLMLVDRIAFIGDESKKTFPLGS